MDDFEIRRWRRYGHDRLYVRRLTDGVSVGWHDLVTGRTEVTDESCRDDVMAALAPHISQQAAPSEPPSNVAVQPSPSPEGPTLDLALNRPGDALRRKIAEIEPSAVKRALAPWLPTAWTPAHSWAVGLRGELVAGRRLDRLRKSGWKTLHSVQLPSGSDIDHLAIGPAGVFTINTKHHRGASLWLGDHAITVNRVPTRYLPISEAEATRTAQRLSARCGFIVAVRPVIAVVGAAKVVVKNATSSVLMVDGARVDRLLSGLSPVLTDDQVGSIYAVARDGRTWDLV